MMREPAFTLLRKPAPMALQGRRALVLGLGDTGLSIARWVAAQGGTVRVADSRKMPPRVADLKGELHTGKFKTSLLKDVDLVCISPGLTLEEEIVQAAIAGGVPVLGDIELFAWAARGKVLAVTGTNGKSTVTALSGHLLREAGIDCEVAGNIGPPALEALRARSAPPAAWVLELSSYQLETTWSLDASAAAMLNLSPDHLDRYARFEDYRAAKARVFAGTGAQVLNRGDTLSMAMAVPGRRQVTFGLDAPAGDAQFGIRKRGGETWLAQGAHPFLDVRQLRISGWHNVANALAAAALARAAGASLEAIAAGLRSFAGLPHRLQRVAARAGIEYFDDSKGTNVGATIAALRGLERRLVLIAGGDGKGQDFAPLAEPVRRYARGVLLIGRDAAAIERALAASGVPVERCGSLEEAVRLAARRAQKGDAVLLSPACASFDMFRDYRHRGEAFAAAVKGLADG